MGLQMDELALVVVGRLGVARAVPVFESYGTYNGRKGGLPVMTSLVIGCMAGTDPQLCQRVLRSCSRGCCFSSWARRIKVEWFAVNRRSLFGFA